MIKKALAAMWLTSMLTVAGCQSAPHQVQPVPVACLPPPQPPAWMMQPEPEQTYTQQLRQTLSE